MGGRTKRGSAVGDGAGQPAPAFDPANPAVEHEEVEVMLLKPHNHQDRDYAVGDKLTVRPPIADWLREHGVIAPQQEDPV